MFETEYHTSGLALLELAATLLPGPAEGIDYERKPPHAQAATHILSEGCRLGGQRGKVTMETLWSSRSRGRQAERRV